MSGTVTADGGDGADHEGHDTGLGNCGQAYVADPDAGTVEDDDVDEATPFIERSGYAGNGGGSAGTVAIGADFVDIRTGVVSARGGDGGDGNLGGGGGGSGGTVKVTAPVYLFTGSGPVIDGGAGGNDLCSGPDTIDGRTTTTGLPVSRRGPTSQATAPTPSIPLASSRSCCRRARLQTPDPTRWHKGDNLVVGFTAKGGYKVPTGFSVAVCGQNKPMKTPVFADVSQIFDLVPVPPTIDNPCGADGALLGKRHVTPTGGRVSVDPTDADGKVTIDIDSVFDEQGYWGLYTVAFRPSPLHPGNDCLATSDGFPAVFDQLCVAEAIEFRDRPEGPNGHPSCTDDQDNDLDGVIDEADPNCSTSESPTTEPLGPVLEPDLVLKIDNSAPWATGGTTSGAPIVSSPRQEPACSCGPSTSTSPCSIRSNRSGQRSSRTRDSRPSSAATRTRPCSLPVRRDRQRGALDR